MMGRNLYVICLNHSFSHCLLLASSHARVCDALAVGDGRVPSLMEQTTIKRLINKQNPNKSIIATSIICYRNIQWMKSSVVETAHWVVQRQTWLESPFASLYNRTLHRDSGSAPVDVNKPVCDVSFRIMTLPQLCFPGWVLSNVSQNFSHHRHDPASQCNA